MFAFFISPARCAARPDPIGARGECLVMSSKILGDKVPYCALLPPSYDSEKSRRYPVLYYLHGLGDNEQMLLRSGGLSMAQDLWDHKELGEFIVVTPRAGSSFYLNSRDGRYRYEDFVLQEFLPFIEGHYRIRPGRASRAIAGISMGGYGALRIAFRRPGLFVAVATHSAALVPNLPDLETSATGRGPLALFGNLFGSPIDRAFWNRNDPLAISKNANLTGLKIYFDCGAQDDYGLDAGAQALHNILTARHIPHEFHLYPGGHSWMYFAEHLPASLEFISRAFGFAAAAR